VAAARARPGRAAGYPEGQRDPGILEPYDDGSECNGDEDGTADAADRTAELKLKAGVGKPGRQRGKPLQGPAGDERALHAEGGGEHATGNMG